MKRSEPTPEKIHVPDVINQSITKEFTQVPNKVLRNPELSFKSKGILCLLLSNKEGWFSYITTIKQMTREGEDAIKSGLAELEEAGYFLRVQYRNKKTKIRRGSFWAYTDIPGNFDMEETIKTLEEQGMELFTHQKNIPESPKVENPVMENPDIENPGLKTINIKRKNEKDIIESSKELSEKANDDSSNEKVNNNSSNNKTNKKYSPETMRLAKFFCDNFLKPVYNLNTTSGSRFWGTVNSIQQILTEDGVPPARLKKIIKWLSKHHGEQFVPQVTTGAQLRYQYLAIEAAMKRKQESSNQKKEEEYDIFNDPEFTLMSERIM